MESSLKLRIWRTLEPRAEDGVGYFSIHSILMMLIVANAAAAVLGTVTSIEQRYGGILNQLETVSLIVFSAEYALRGWSCTVSTRYRGSRWRYLVSPLAIVDLLAILPGLLALVSIISPGVIDARMLRLLRMLRLFRLFKLSRYAESLALIGKVFMDRRNELLMALFNVGLMIFFTASLMYYAERDAQPENYTSIPATMWWSICTLTTVGYGDMYPITPIGKILGGIVAVLGVGLFALPAGILASGFGDEMKSRREAALHKPTPPWSYCPHCGKNLPHHGEEDE